METRFGRYNHDLRRNNGGTILLPPDAQYNNIAIPDVYVQDSSQKYDIGSLFNDGFRTYRYAYNGGATTLTQWRGAFNYDQWSVTNANIAAAAAVGATSISVANTAATLDLYVNGWVVIFTSPLQMRRIIGNDATDATNCTLYLDYALTTAVTTSTWATAYLNPYQDTRYRANDEYGSVVCVPNINVTTAYYYWGQTSGPCYGVVESTVPGASASRRKVYFSVNGHLWDYGDISSSLGVQVAGYLLPRTGSGSGDQLYMLQLEGAAVA